jgi:DNA modification methylase
MPDASVDAVVTDPPYGLSFMGKRWDYDVPSEDVWRECLRVLKPGGHLLAFAGTRTQHRMAVRIEDAGFEIRDMIAWVYGSGFPKSLDVSKAIDKTNGEPGRSLKFTLWFRTAGLTTKKVTRMLQTAGVISENGTMAGHYFAKSRDGQPAIPTAAIWQVIRPHIAEVPDWVDELVARIEAEREVVKEDKRVRVGTSWETRSGMLAAGEQDFSITAPATDAARQWAGWGTALKPALEPITVARKPLVGTVAANVLEHGTGAINVDGCRVSGWNPQVTQGVNGNASSFNVAKKRQISGDSNEGRWPANLIHDGSDEVVKLFPSESERMEYVAMSGEVVTGEEDGSAARFFYCAKASKADRDQGCERLELKRTAKLGGSDNDREDLDPVSDRFRTQPSRNNHPTVKPTYLMRYLCRLVTPPGGLVLDPFTGSGSTGKAAILEGFRFVGIEREAEYVEIARARIAAAEPDQLSLL